MVKERLRAMESKRKMERDNNTEWHGVGFDYREELEKCTELYKQVSSRHIELQFAAGAGPIKFTNYHAPQCGQPPNESSSTTKCRTI